MLEPRVHCVTRSKADVRECPREIVSLFSTRVSALGCITDHNISLSLRIRVLSLRETDDFGRMSIEFRRRGNSSRDSREVSRKYLDMFVVADNSSGTRLVSVCLRQFPSPESLLYLARRSRSSRGGMNSSNGKLRPFDTADHDASDSLIIAR